MAASHEMCDSAVEIKETPDGITKRFFEADIPTRVKIINETPGPIIMTNITNTGESAKPMKESYAVSIPGYKPSDESLAGDWVFWDSSCSFHIQVMKSYCRECGVVVSDNLLCEKNIQFHGFCNGKPTRVVYDLGRYIDNCHSRSSKILDMMLLYDTNGWINQIGRAHV